MAPRPALEALAERIGIAREYVPSGSRAPVAIADDTRIALLAALGLDAASEEAAKSALGGLEAAERARGLPPTWGIAAGARAISLPLLDEQRSAPLQAELREEDGARREVAVRCGRLPNGRARARIALPPLAPGYHELLVRGAGQGESSVALLAAPARCYGVRDALGDAPAFGIWANLYALRSEKGLGFGDFGALRELVRFAGRCGAAFVGLSPLHAVRGEGPHVSPYSPQSRWFRSPLYLELDAVPELADCAEARALLAREDVRREITELRAAAWLDYDRLDRVQGPLLRALHRCFAAGERGRDTPRGRAYAQYLREQGALLGDFAAFRALADWLAQRGHARDWHAWPEPYRDPRAPAVAAFGAEHAEDIDFHCYVQFELDRQLAVLAGVGRAAGLGLGLYTDLAIGSAPGGFDTWVLRDLFVAGASVGAPADAMAEDGQNWGFSPFDPAVLARRGYADWARLVRANLRHTGALRIDHILGLVRQWWVPAGASAARGAYVRYPLADLLAVLAIESQRARALIIGEDLGTIPAGLASRLAARGVLSLRVLLFERDRRGGFRAAARYSRRALTSANTHDVPTLAAFWTGRDLELRRELGLIEGEQAWQNALAERERARRALLARLQQEGLLEPGAALPAVSGLIRAVHAFLCRTPSPLIAAALGDLTAETEPVNLPGVPMQIYPSWSRRMEVAVEALATAPQLAETLAGLEPRSRPPGR